MFGKINDHNTSMRVLNSKKKYHTGIGELNSKRMTLVNFNWFIKNAFILDFICPF